jgi:hypothetical protein
VRQPELLRNQIKELREDASDWVRRREMRRRPQDEHTDWAALLEPFRPAADRYPAFAATLSHMTRYLDGKTQEPLGTNEMAMMEVKPKKVIRAKMGDPLTINAADAL